MTKNTPTPWEVDFDEDEKTLDIIGPWKLVGKDEWEAECVCTMNQVGRSKAKPNTDAAYIVRAVNAHEELIVALQLLREAVSDSLKPGHKHGNGYCGCKSALHEANRAMLKAKGK